LVVTDGVFWETAVMEAASGIGSLTFIADGAMVIANTPLIEWYGPLVQKSIEFYVMVRHAAPPCPYRTAPIKSVAAG
jgi:hypothetical protein